MSTFTVLEMPRDVAMAGAKTRTKGTRNSVKAPGGLEPIPLTEWMELTTKKTEQIMRKNTVHLRIGAKRIMTDT